MFSNDDEDPLFVVECKLPHFLVLVIYKHVTSDSYVGLEPKSGAKTKRRELVFCWEHVASGD